MNIAEVIQSGAAYHKTGRAYAECLPAFPEVSLLTVCGSTYIVEDGEQEEAFCYINGNKYYPDQVQQFAQKLSEKSGISFDEGWYAAPPSLSRVPAPPAHGWWTRHILVVFPLVYSMVLFIVLLWELALARK